MRYNKRKHYVIKNAKLLLYFNDKLIKLINNVKI